MSKEIQRFLKAIENKKICENKPHKEWSDALDEVHIASSRIADPLKALIRDYGKMRDAVLAVLCDPEGTPVFHGSDSDRAAIADALTLSQAHRELIDVVGRE